MTFRPTLFQPTIFGQNAGQNQLIQNFLIFSVKISVKTDVLFCSVDIEFISLIAFLWKPLTRPDKRVIQ